MAVPLWLNIPLSLRRSFLLLLLVLIGSSPRASTLFVQASAPAESTAAFSSSSSGTRNNDDNDNISMENNQQRRRVVLVIGSHGRTGQRIISQLAASPLYEPLALIRDPAQQAHFDQQGVATVLGDVRHDDWEDILAGKRTRMAMTTGATTEENQSITTTAPTPVDMVIFSAGGRTLNQKGYEGTVQVDLAGAIRIISACQVSESVSRFVMLSGTNVDFDTTSKLTHWHRAKAYADTFLRDSATFGRPLNWTIVCPATLNDDELEIVGHDNNSNENNGSANNDDQNENAECDANAPAATIPTANNVQAIVHPDVTAGAGVGNSSRNLVALAIVALLDMTNTYSKSFTR